METARIVCIRSMQGDSACGCISMVGLCTRSLGGWGLSCIGSLGAIIYRAAACDVTGGVASLNFAATELQIF